MDIDSSTDTAEQRRRREQEREDMVHAAGIRGMLYAAHHLPPASGSRAFRLRDIPDLPQQVVECDSEGGEI